MIIALWGGQFLLMLSHLYMTVCLLFANLVKYYIISKDIQ